MATVVVPSLEGQMLLSDPESIIAYTLRRYGRTPKDTIPILPNLIISLPWQIFRFGESPDSLVTNIQSDLQGVFNRIFGGQRQVQVTASFMTTSSISYDVNISVVYYTLNGELKRRGTSIKLVNGQLSIPEDRIEWITEVAS